MLPVADAPDAPDILVLGAEPSGRFRSLLSLVPDLVPEISFADTAPDDIAVIAYTSGTTGRPKGAAHGHGDLIAATESYFRHCVRPRVGDVIAGPPAIPFTLGMGFFIYFPLWFGAAAVVGADKRPEACADAIRRHGATILVAVPTYYNQLMRHLRATGTTLPSLRQSLIGGEPLYPELEDAWRAETGLALVQFIGTTEMFHIFISYRHGLDEPRAGCLGRAVPGYEVTVRDPETFAEVANGEHGLLCVRGPTSCVYWSPREIQPDAVRDGWNIVQDTVWKDDEGFVHFVSRRDEMIVSGGFNIAPADVERVLIRHPAIAECACAASPDETGERVQVVKAFVVLADGFAPGDGLKSEIQAFFKDNGPPFMYPRKLDFVAELPKGITGKVLRSELRRREANTAGP
jgi:2-aminobenzoate-CoA ligase